MDSAEDVHRTLTHINRILATGAVDGDWRKELEAESARLEARLEQLGEGRKPNPNILPVPDRAMTIFEWLELPCASRGYGRCIDRVAELFAVNYFSFSVDIAKVGQVRKTTASPYARMGLRADEALELMYLAGVLEGFRIQHPDPANARSVADMIVQSIFSAAAAAKKIANMPADARAALFRALKGGA